MKSFSFAKALAAGCLLCLSLPAACSDDKSNPPSKAGSSGEAGSGATDGGAGGAAGIELPPGISNEPKQVECGAEMCGSAMVGPVYIDPCCDSDACGLNTGFLELAGASFTNKCQPKDQPGEVDEACPSTAPSQIPYPAGGTTIMVPINGFAGCCRDNGTCGVVVDEVVAPLLGKTPLATLGLGCVDAAPFFPGEDPVSCGAGGGSAGGAGGTTGGAGAGGETSTPGGGGAGGAGGAGGNQ